MPRSPLFEFGLSVERIKAARRAIDASGTRVLLTGRSEGFIVGRPDLAETIRRLTAYAEAGADCLYAPGITKDEEIAAVVQAVAPKPVNVLVGSDFATVQRLAAIGCSPHQRRRRAGAHGVGGFSECGEGNCRARDVRGAGPRHAGRRVEQGVRTGPPALGLRTMTNDQSDEALTSLAVAALC